MQKILLIRGRVTRFDKANPDENWAGPAALWFEAEALPSDVQYETVRADEYSGTPPDGTTHIVCAGLEAARLYFQGDNLDSMRGVVRVVAGIPIIATYNIQDCIDLKNYDDFDDEENEIDAANTGKDSMPTRRTNYPFWVCADVEKVLGRRELAPVDAGQVTGALKSFELEYWCNYFKPGDIMFLDIESHPKTNTLQTVSFAGRTGPIASFVVYDYMGRLAQSHSAFAAFARALRRCHVVAHNAMFDLSFLGIFCGMPWPDKISDTMLMWHRRFPEAEKSIAHVISYCTNHPYHKDESGSFDPRTRDALARLVAYNAKDVQRLREVYYYLLNVGVSPGLRASMEQVNTSIPHYLFAGFHGFELDLGRLIEHRRELRARQAQLRRIFNILVGQEINPASPQQVGAYLYNKSGRDYKPPGFTDTGAPATDAAALYKLRLTHPENVALSVLLQIKGVDKQISMLKFKAFDYIKGRR